VKKLLLLIGLVLFLISCQKEEEYKPDCEKYNTATIVVKNCLPYSVYVYVNWDCISSDGIYYTRPYEYEEYCAPACGGVAYMMVEVDGVQYHDSTYVELEQCGKSRLEIGSNLKGDHKINAINNL
jgi:hypothetical protein